MLLPCLELTFIAHQLGGSTADCPPKIEETSSPIYSLLDIGARLCKYKLFFLSSNSPRIFDVKVGSRTKTRKMNSLTVSQKGETCCQKPYCIKTPARLDLTQKAEKKRFDAEMPSCGHDFEQF